MSQTELDRFAAAVSDNPALAQDYKDLGSAAAMAARLRADGYDVSDAELEDAARSGRTLSDEQLDRVTGGALGLVFGALTAVGAVATFGTVAVLAIVHGVKPPPKAG
ncbi:putative ribosomally synthesized peptide with nif11-like leader [Azospirillum agricola]|uniref:Nif11-like leader peptide family RiPP precursor n=1 Tax=Azospirillum agricola TaxID=1720247 RepID=UPI001AE3745D|nr:Nif11-like leader peptide family RiPP precursor [Azospirillum agricola]MBP2230948.1 putative ribosomally synthesized peptide with nif11-like leader [Azospirillum agricola]